MSSNNVIYGSESLPKTDKEWHDYWYFTANKPDDYPHIKLQGKKINLTTHKFTRKAMKVLVAIDAGCLVACCLLWCM